MHLRMARGVRTGLVDQEASIGCFEGCGVAFSFETENSKKEGQGDCSCKVKREGRINSKLNPREG